MYPYTYNVLCNISYIALGITAESAPKSVGSTLALRAEGKMKPSGRLQLLVASGDVKIAMENLH